MEIAGPVAEAAAAAEEDHGFSFPDAAPDAAPAEARPRASLDDEFSFFND